MTSTGVKLMYPVLTGGDECTTTPLLHTCIIYKYKNLKDEVGMAGSKSTQTGFVGIITSTIHPYA